MKELERVNGVGLLHHVLLLQLLNTEDLASNFFNFLMGRWAQHDCLQACGSHVAAGAWTGLSRGFRFTAQKLEMCDAWLTGWWVASCKRNSITLRNKWSHTRLLDQPYYFSPVFFFWSSLRPSPTFSISVHKIIRSSTSGLGNNFSKYYWLNNSSTDSLEYQTTPSKTTHMVFLFLSLSQARDESSLSWTSVVVMAYSKIYHSAPGIEYYPSSAYKRHRYEKTWFLVHFFWWYIFFIFFTNRITSQPSRSLLFSSGNAFHTHRLTDTWRFLWRFLNDLEGKKPTASSLSCFFCAGAGIDRLPPRKARLGYRSSQGLPPFTGRLSASWRQGLTRVELGLVLWCLCDFFCEMCCECDCDVLCRVSFLLWFKSDRPPQTQVELSWLLLWSRKCFFTMLQIFKILSVTAQSSRAGERFP